MKKYMVTFSRDDWYFTIEANNLKEAKRKAQVMKSKVYKGVTSVRLIK